MSINLVECKIKEIHSVTDVSDEFETERGYKPRETMLEIDMTYEKLGKIERDKFWYYKSDWESLRVSGCFWGEL